MRIIFITSSTNKSGGSRQALYLAQGLRARGHKVSFFTEQKAQIRSLDSRVDWRDLPTDKSQWRTAVEAALPSDGSPALVHAFHNAAVKKLAWWSIFWKKRNIISVGHRGVIYHPGNPFTYWSPGFDAFIVNSKACADVLRKYRTPAHKLHVVYNGIPPERLAPAHSVAEVLHALNIPCAPKTGEFSTPEKGFENVPCIFGAVAGDNPIKGTKIALEAFAKAALPHAYFVIIGVTPEKWIPLCHGLHISEHVRLIGKIENVADYLQCFNAFILPSLTESMPNTLMEAVGMGLPSIASSVGGVPELIDGNGILVPAGNVGALCDAMQKMANDHAQREQWAEQSRTLAHRYALERRLVTIERIYENLFSARGLNAD